MTAELRELRADLDEVKRARFPAAPSRDPAQNQIGGGPRLRGNGGPQLGGNGSPLRVPLPDEDELEDHRQGHADKESNLPHGPRGEELPHGRREGRHDDGDYYESRRDADNYYERRRDADYYERRRDAGDYYERRQVRGDDHDCH